MCVEFERGCYDLRAENIIYRISIKIKNKEVVTMGWDSFGINRKRNARQ
jgi:hypothetical protein